MSKITVKELESLTANDDGVARKDGNAELQRRFNKDLLPALGKTSVSSVSVLGH